MRTNRLVLAFAVLMVSGWSARAQVLIDVSKITCEQYVFSKVASPITISVWLSGYYNGKRGSTVVDLQDVQSKAEKVEHFCRQNKNLNVPVMKAAESTLGAPK